MDWFNTEWHAKISKWKELKCTKFKTNINGQRKVIQTCKTSRSATYPAAIDPIIPPTSRLLMNMLPAHGHKAIRFIVTTALHTVSRTNTCNKYQQWTASIKGAMLLFMGVWNGKNIVIMRKYIGTENRLKHTTDELGKSCESWEVKCNSKTKQQSTKTQKKHPSRTQQLLQ